MNWLINLEKKEGVMKTLKESIEITMFLLYPVFVIAVVLISVIWNDKFIFLTWPNLFAYEKSIYQWFIDIQEKKLVSTFKIHLHEN